MFKISEPTLLLDRAKVLRNLEGMMEKVGQTRVFRPHFKTHQSRVVADWLRDKGIGHITVSSMGMAEYFAGGWEDITIAFPFVVHDLERLNALIDRQPASILTDSEELINRIKGRLTGACGVWLEVESGSGRTGLLPREKAKAAGILELGHSYRGNDPLEISEVYRRTMEILLEFKAEFAGDFPELKINIGDTPSCSMVEDFGEAESISAGNFIFYDVTQAHLGSCTTGDIAVCLAAPVVGIYPDRGEVAVKGGGIHLSKDSLQMAEGVSYGLPVLLSENGWTEPVEGGNVRSISQEHGMVTLPAVVIEKLELGDALGILPVHSCMTAECMG